MVASFAPCTSTITFHGTDTRKRRPPTATCTDHTVSTPQHITKFIEHTVLTAYHYEGFAHVNSSSTNTARLKLWGLTGSFVALIAVFLHAFHSGTSLAFVLDREGNVVFHPGTRQRGSIVRQLGYTYNQAR